MPDDEHRLDRIEDPDDPEAVHAELAAALEAMQAFENEHLRPDGTFGQLDIGGAHDLARLQQRLEAARARHGRVFPS
ncbi:MAG: hypothetical protein WCL53_02960 [Chloroflexota bacterium]